MSSSRDSPLQHLVTLFSVALALVVVCSTAVPFIVPATASTTTPAEPQRIGDGTGEMFAEGTADGTALKVSTSDGTAHYATAGGPIVVDPDITVGSEDSLSGATVSIKDGFTPPEDSLDVTIDGGIDKSYNADTGVLTLSGTATAAEYQRVLRTVTYDNSAGTPATADRQIAFSTGDDDQYFEETSHYYQYVQDEGATWQQARDSAEGMTYHGLQGYLATITSSEENEFVLDKIQAAETDPESGWNGAWLGGSDAETEGTWRWVTGPENGTVFYTDPNYGGDGVQTYANWVSDPAQPDNHVNQDYFRTLHTRSPGQWDDVFGGRDSTDGYVVEYGGLASDPELRLEDTKTVSVSNAPTASGTANRTTVPVDGTIALDASNSSDDNGVADYSWSVTGGSLSAETGETTTATFSEAGTQNVTLTVTDTDGNTDETTFSVTIDGTAPTADAGGNQTIDLGDSATFDASESTDENGIVSYDWAFDDGTNATGVSPTHTFSSGGDHTATLTVTDTAGNTATDTATVRVRSANVSVRIDSPEPTVTAGDSLSVNATVTNDGDLQATQPVTFSIDGTTVNTTNVTLDGGASETVEFTYQTTANDSPSLDVTVTTGDSTDTTTATVLTPSNFAVGNLSTEDSVTAGSDLIITATVTNTGETTDTQEITTVVDGTIVGTQQVTLESDESREIETVYTTTEAGDFDVTVESDDDSVSTTAQVNTPSDFGVTIDSTNESVTTGDDIVVEGTVTNDGGTADTQNVSLAIDGSIVDTREVTLDLGESTSVDFTYPTAEDDTPTVEVALSSDDDRDNATVTVNTPAFFNVTDTTTNGPVTAGDELTVTSTVTNTGETVGTREIPVSIDGTTVGTREVTLAPGESQDVEVTYVTSETDVGELDVVVESDDDAESTTAQVNAPASFDVSIDGTIGPVTAGDDLVVEGTVTNDGGTTDTQQVPLTVGGTTVETRSVSLDPGESTSVSYTYSTTDEDLPEVDLTLSSDDDSANTTVEVLTPAFFDVNDTSTNEPVTVGEDLVISSTVTNTGETTGTQDVSITVNGTLIETQSVTLAPGESQEVEATYSTTEDDVGDLSVIAASDDDSERTTAEVLTPGALDVDINGTNDPVTAGDDLLVIGIITNTGQTETTQEIPLSIDGEVVETRTVTLRPGESTSVDFIHSTTVDDVPSVEVQLSSDNDRANTTADVLRPGNFAVRIDETNGPVTAGEDLLVNGTVTNTGEVTESQVVNSTVNGEVVGTQNVTLDPNESTPVNFTYPTTSEDVPSINVTVNTNDSSDHSAVRVNTPADFDVNITDANESVTVGDDLLVTGTVTNTGGTEAIQEIPLTVNGTTVTTETVTLDSRESTTVTYSYPTVKDDVPAVDVELSSDDDSDTVTVSVNTPALFDVTDTRTNSPVTAGEDLAINSTVTNTGETTDTQEVPLTVDGAVVATQNVTLAPGVSQEIEATYTTGEDDVGEFNVTVESNDDVESTTAQVNAPRNFDVGIDSTNGPVTAGDDLVVTVNVTNNGGTADTQQIPLTIDGTQVGMETVTLTPGESTSVDYTYPTTDEDVPGVEVGLSSDDDSTTTSVDVLTPAFFDVNDVSTNEPITVGGDLLINSTITNTGQTAATQQVPITVNGTVVDTKEIALEPGESQRTETTYSTTEADVGDLNVAVASDDDSESTTAEVLTPGSLDVDIDGTNDPVTAGDDLLVNGTVTNTGQTETTQEVPLTVDGEVVGTETVILGPNESVAVNYTYSTTEDDVPSVDVDLRSDDDQANTTVDVLEPGNFAVGIDETNGPVTAGDDLLVNSTVTNTGQTTEMQQVDITVDGEVVGTQNVTLGPGESTPVNFTYPTTDGDVPGADIAVNTEDDSANTTVPVYTPAAFDVTNTATNGPVTAGDDLTINSTVTNTGQTAATQQISITANGTVVDTQVITLEAGESQTIETTYTTTEENIGEIDITVASDDDADNASALVLKPGAFDVTNTTVSGPVAAGDDLTISSVVTNTGETTATQQVIVTANRAAVDTQNVTLAPGESPEVETAAIRQFDSTVSAMVDTQNVTLDPGESREIETTYATTEADVGALNVTIASDDDSESTTTEVLTPGVLDVNIDSTSESVVAGEELLVNGTVTNTGETNTTQEIPFIVNGTVADTQTVTLEPGESIPANFSYPTTGDDMPAVHVGLRSDDDSDNATVPVLEPGAFDVTNMTTSGPVVAGENITIGLTVINTGGTTATQQVNITVNGIVIGTEMVTLGPNESTSVSALYQTTEDDIPGIDVVVNSEDTSKTAAITVDAPEPPTTEPNTTTPTTEPNTTTPTTEPNTTTPTTESNTTMESPTTLTTEPPATAPNTTTPTTAPNTTTPTAEPPTTTLNTATLTTTSTAEPPTTGPPTRTPSATVGTPSTDTLTTESPTAETGAVTVTETATASTPAPTAGPAGTPATTVPKPPTTGAATAVETKTATAEPTVGETDGPKTGTPPASPPPFTVNVTPENIETSDSAMVAVTAIVNNTGDRADTQPIIVSVDDQVVATTSVTLEPSESEAVTFTTSLGTDEVEGDTTSLSIYTPADRETFAVEMSTDDSGPATSGTSEATATTDAPTGNGTATVTNASAGGNDSDSVTSTETNESETLSVTLPNSNVEVSDDGSVTATATITNPTNTTVSQPVTLTEDGEVVDTASVTVDSSETKTVTLSAPANTVDENESGETSDLSVQTPSGGVTKVVTVPESKSGETTVEAVGSNTSASASTFYQVDLVQGEPIENLGESGTYGSDELVRFAHGNSDGGLIRHSDGMFTTNESLSDRITTEAVSVENGTATTTITVSEGAPITLSLVSYEKVGPGWTRERESLQTFDDADTRMLGAGTHTFTVKLPSGDKEDESAT